MDIKRDRQFLMLLHEVGHQDRNLKGIAAVLGVPYSTLAEQLNPNIQYKKFDIGLLPDFLDAADEDNRVLHYLAQRRGGVFVDLAASEAQPTANLADCLREFGDMVRAHAEMDEDNRREPDEINKVKREGYEALRAITAYLACLEPQ